MAKDEKTVHGRVVAISEYLDAQGRLDGYAFHGCQINGPAVLFFQGTGNSFQNNTFDEAFDEIFWEIPLTRKRFVGAVGVTNCVFDHCRLTAVGVAGPPEFIDRWRKEG